MLSYRLHEIQTIIFIKESMPAYGKLIAPSSIQHDTLTIRTTNPVVAARLQIQSKIAPKRVLPERFLQGFLIFALSFQQAPLVFPRF